MYFMYAEKQYCKEIQSNINRTSSGDKVIEIFYSYFHMIVLVAFP